MIDAWHEGFRADAVAKHVHECWWCRWILFDEQTIEVEAMADRTLAKIHEKMERAEARHLTVRRRRFMVSSAAAAVLVVGLGLGFWHLGHKKGAEEAVTTPPPPTLSWLGPDMAALDTILCTNSVPDSNLFVARVLNGTKSEITKALEWVTWRNHYQLVPDIVGFLTSNSAIIRQEAFLTLSELPKNVVKPHMRTIRQAATIGTLPKKFRSALVWLASTLK